MSADDTGLLRGGIVGDTVSKGIPRRLMDKAIALLFAAVVFFVMGWGTIVWVKANTAELKNVTQDEQIKAVVERIGGIEKKLDRQDDKLDRVLDRLPK